MGKSNLAFKLVTVLTDSQTAYTSLPFLNPYPLASTLYYDVFSAGGRNITISNVDTGDSYSGAPVIIFGNPVPALGIPSLGGGGGVDFFINEGDGIQIVWTTSGGGGGPSGGGRPSRGAPVLGFGGGGPEPPTTGIPFTITGSHDPTFTFHFTASTTKTISLPYNTTAVTASDLYTELTNAGGQNVCVSVFNQDTQLFDSYCGGGFDPNFTVVTGVSYQVISGVDFSWTPKVYS